VKAAFPAHPLDAASHVNEAFPSSSISELDRIKGSERIKLAGYSFSTHHPG
jgi:hypothetical protein